MTTATRTTTEALIETTQTAIAEAQQAALDAALMLRDLEHGKNRRILPVDDPALRAAQDADTAACKTLDRARAELRRLQSDLEREQAEASAHERTADHQRRRAWALAEEPALGTELDAAGDELARLQATPFAWDSPSGQYAIAAAKRRVQRAQAKIEYAARQAPAAE